MFMVMFPCAVIVMIADHEAEYFDKHPSLWVSLRERANDRLDWSSKPRYWTRSDDLIVLCFFYTYMDTWKNPRKVQTKQEICHR